MTAKHITAVPAKIATRGTVVYLGNYDPLSLRWYEIQLAERGLTLKHYGKGDRYMVDTK